MSAISDPYANLADLYDSLAGLEDIKAMYAEWRDSLMKAVHQYRLPVHTLVDLACGTGNSTIPWTIQKGWTVIGVDRSRAMLREARKKSKKVHWVCQDLKDLELEEKADAATCHFDALNHILNARELQVVFDRVAGILNKSGLFLFDLNTDFWLRWLSVHEKLTRIGSNYLMTYNAYDSRKRVATFHLLWFVRHKNVFKKRLITVQEASYAQEEVREMLHKSGFRLQQISVHRKIDGKPIRLLYLARKVRG